MQEDVQMSIAERIREQVLAGGAELTIRRAQIGLTYCAVQLEDGNTGVAYTFPRQACGSQHLGAGPLAGRQAGELVKNLGSENLIASALGLAAANALISGLPASEGLSEGDILERLDIHEGDQVCMVGCFLPVLQSLKLASVQVRAVDQVAKPGAEPAENSETLLPNSQVAIITATAIVNGTMDRLLELAAGCREVAILGPSTPMLPAAFGDLPVHCLAGIRVEQPDPVFGVIAEGGGYCYFKDYTTKLNIRL